jgi:hypothetical protein
MRALTFFSVLVIVTPMIGCDTLTAPRGRPHDEATGQPPSYDLAVEINGPTSIGPNESCSWTASVRGAREPVSLAWYRRDDREGSWLMVETLPVCSGGMNGHASFELRLDVTDSTNRLASQRIKVLSGSDSVCTDESEGRP